jgi:hypothetical protein
MNEVNDSAAARGATGGLRRPARHRRWFIHRVRLCRDDPDVPMNDRNPFARLARIGYARLQSPRRPRRNPPCSPHALPA